MYQVIDTDLFNPLYETFINNEIEILHILKDSKRIKVEQNKLFSYEN